MRSQFLLIAVAGSAVVGGGALYASHSRVADAQAIGLTHVRSVAQSTADTGAPTVLPDIAHLVSEAGEPKAPGAVFRMYSLAGAANTSNITPTGMALHPEQMRPATFLQIGFVPNFPHPDVPGDEKYCDISTVDVNGSVATVTVMKTGLGAERIDWVDADGDYHYVMTERLTTKHGLSGLDVDTLLQIARSIGA